ncbi:energy-coupling factor transporter transmembrane protein EcfT [Actinobacteria bacterium YIM 96077]|uniref:Energy-coupling factor transporter transmembrane protein EcfT n=1 Tax=Phytoactinopolyspora halophila TaxID=1981511 RepID=A0A329R3U3_9ACTN|nr:energy-coupling factor transporter transmembrane component T [Phytoactinopolyspora halophila]AYY12108.1 energy-coupling factor transporter transmembrane protein EcfT [Actinobacteria bacterium YIM 96077]RAW18656.1 energy-coupling factor transporter transmembrane protein EcfT [Phytoactinopolyspora halophila]
MLIGAYIARPSPLHRVPAGAKLILLAVACAALLAVRTPAGVGASVLAVVVLYAFGRLRPGEAWTQVRPLRWFVLVILVVQLLITDWVTAVSLTSRIVLAVALAGLVTLTTRTSELMAAIERGLSPLRRFGVDPARVSLVMSLAIRSVPVVAGIAQRVRDAQRARGQERSIRAFAVPLVVGVLRYADTLGEALHARGMDD